MPFSRNGLWKTMLSLITGAGAGPKGAQRPGVAPSTLCPGGSLKAEFFFYFEMSSSIYLKGQ